MLSNESFRNYGHQIVDWIADYLDKIEDFPVRSTITPGALKQELPDAMPSAGENMAEIWQDFKQQIPPGLTHWQHPGFMALFPSNSSYPSVLAEMLMAGLGVNAMVWETSPAATELEETVMEWIRKASGLPEGWTGVIHDTASTSTLTAIISAREKTTQFAINTHGFSNHTHLRLYCSAHTHYSIEKGAKAAGFGLDNVIKIPVDAQYAMQPAALEEQIIADIAAGKKPCIVVATLGTTSTLAFDPLDAIAAICKKYQIWLHIDAAYAGSAFFLPEQRHWMKGIEHADSYVFNAHKWLFTNFDCSCYYVKDAKQLVDTFSSNPDYLKRTLEGVVNYKDWGLPLGRRFRALKLWFVLRNMGVDGIQHLLRKHIDIALMTHKMLTTDPRWETCAPPALNMFCVRYIPTLQMPLDAINTLNQKLLQAVNAEGNFYLSGTTVDGRFMIRVVMGNTYLEEKHVAGLLETLRRNAQTLTA